MAVEVTALEHLIGAFRGLDFGIRPVPPNEQVGGAPDVEVRNHGPIFEAIIYLTKQTLHFVGLNA